MRTEPSIREATLADADELGRISGRAWEATYRGMIPDGVLDEWIASAGDGWRQALEHPEPDSSTRSWVAVRDGALLGFAVTSPARSNWLPPPEGAGELTNLYLDPDAIGSGVGRPLFERAAGDLRDRGFNPLVVWAFRDNLPAQGFYEHMGLTIDVPDHAWLLGGVACPIVRFRLDWPRAE
jgi:GNAT superfamily N-acetyltransferase